jgi:hypothetical protein
LISYKFYYEYLDGETVPQWLVINVKESEINWCKEFIPVSIQHPIEMFDSNELERDSMSVSISPSELTLTSNENQVGIDSILLKDRLDKHGVEIFELDYLLIRIVDLEEILSMTI